LLQKRRMKIEDVEIFITDMLLATISYLFSGNVIVTGITNIIFAILFKGTSIQNTKKKHPEILAFKWEKRILVDPRLMSESNRIQGVQDTSERTNNDPYAACNL